MTDSSKPKITDAQVEATLKSFFAAEMPESLNVPPSQWPAIQSGTRVTPVATVRPTDRATSGFGRVAAIVIATAACLVMVAVLPSGTQDAQPTLNISKDGDSTLSEEPIFDGQPTLDEIDDLNEDE